jgi:hypothetical protein
MTSRRGRDPFHGSTLFSLGRILLSLEPREVTPGFSVQTRTSLFARALSWRGHHSRLWKGRGGQIPLLPIHASLHREPERVPQCPAHGVGLSQRVRPTHLLEICPIVTRGGSGGKRLSPFLLPLKTTSESQPARLTYPKNLTIRFGAHRSSIYAGNSAAKTAALTASSKDPVRETHAIEHISRPIHPRIFEEEFPEYHTLLDIMQVEPNPITLPNIPALGPVPSAS